MKHFVKFTICLALLLIATELSSAQKPELVVQAGHSDVVMSLAFSPDGRICASGSRDRTIKLWDIRTGRLLRTLVGHTGRVNSLVFSSDNQALASASKAGTSTADSDGDDSLRLWHIETGELLRVIPFADFAFSPDGAILAAIAAGENVRGDKVNLWNARTGRFIRAQVATAPLKSISFSPDGRLFTATVAEDESGGNRNERSLGPAVWDVKTGRVLFKLIDCESVTFTSDSKLIIGDLRQVFSAADGRLLRQLDKDTIALSPDGNTAVSFDGEQTFNVFDVKSNRIRDSFTGYYLTPRIRFSNDGRLLVIDGSPLDNKPSVQFRDTHTGRQFPIAPNRLFVDFAPDNSRFLLALGVTTDESSESTIAFEFWDAHDGKFLNHIGTHYKAVILGGPDGFTLSSGGAINADPIFSSDGSMLAWAKAESFGLFARNGSPLFTFSGRQDSVNALAFSPDNHRLAVMKGPDDNSGSAQRYELWDIQGGILNRIFTPRSNDGDSEFNMGFSADGQLLFTVAGGSVNMQTMQEVSFESESNELYRLLDRLKISDPPSKVALSPDGKLVAVCCDRVASKKYEFRLELYDVFSGKALRNAPVIGDIVHHFAFSPDGQLISVTSGSGSGGFVESQVFDLKTGTELTHFFGDDEEEADSSNKSEFLTFSPDSRVAVLQGRCAYDAQYCAPGAIDSWTGPSVPLPALVELRDARNGKLIKAFRSGAARASSAAYTPDGKILAVGCDDASVKLWSTDSGELLATVFSFEGDNWLAVTPDGLFDGSPTAWNQVIWRFNNNTFNYAPVESFFNDFYYPGLLAEIFAGKRPSAPSDISQKDRRQPQLKLTVAESQSGAAIETRNVTVKIEVSQAAAGVQDVRLFRNGSLVKVWHGDALKGQARVVLEATIPIVTGENKLTAYAFNKDDIKSGDVALVINGADSLKRRGTAYVLAVGVNIYSNSQYDLKYAVPDAEDFSTEIRRQQEALKNYSRVEAIHLYDKDATKANIMQALSRLAEQAQPEDAVIVYFSGHGTARQQRFYLIPYDLGYQGPRTVLSEPDLQTILQHSISDREMEAAFEKIDAARLLMVIDACNSGQALDSEEKRRGPMNSKGLAQLAYEKGMYILTASQSFQAAWEAARLGHGYLTYALIEEGLKQGIADREPKDGVIVLREWLNYATEQVPRLQKEKLKQTSEIKGQQRKELELVFVPGDEAIKDATKRTVQTPRVFYRREPETQPLVVGRP